MNNNMVSKFELECLLLISDNHLLKFKICSHYKTRTLKAGIFIPKRTRIYIRRFAYLSEKLPKLNSLPESFGIYFS